MKSAILIRVLEHNEYRKPKSLREVTFYEIPDDASFLKLCRKNQSGQFCGSYDCIDVNDAKQAALYPDTVAHYLKTRPDARVYMQKDGKYSRIARKALP